MQILEIKILILLPAFLSFGLLSWIAAGIITETIHKYEKVYVERTSRTLAGMFLFMDVKRLFYLNLIVMLVFLSCAAFVSRNPLIIAAAGGGGYFLPKIWLKVLRQKRLTKFEDQLVDSVMMMSNAMRSGMNILQAIHMVEREQDPPISQEFGLVLREYKVGVHLEEAFENLADRIPLEDLYLIVSSVNMAMESGGRLTEMLDKLAHVIQKRRKLEGKLKVMTAQGRLQAAVVTILPFFLGYSMYLIDPVMMTRMVTSTWGIIMLGVMVTLQMMGFVTIRKITTLEG